MSPELNSFTFRKRGLQYLIEGIAITNKTFGLSIPPPIMHHWKMDVLKDNQNAEANNFFGQLLAAIFDAPGNEGWTSLIQRFDELFLGPLAEDRLFDRIRELSALDAEALI